MSHAGHPAFAGRKLAFLGYPLQNVVSTSFPAAVGWRDRMHMPNITQLLIILVIVALIFGTKRLKEVGGDLGGAVKSFKKAMSASGELDETPSEPPKQLARDEEQQKQ
jgi:sec-independent protein translocase protein TatA